ncbi:MAG: AgmX/PglI C-terminal domain-containing protein [Minicystis sp.]
MKTSTQSSLDLTLSWRGDRLSFRCLDRAGEVWVGDRPGSLGQIPCEDLGGVAFMVARRAAKEALAFIPAGKMGTLHRADGEIALIEGSAEIALVSGETLVLVLGDFTLTAAMAPIESLVAPRGKRSGGGAWSHIAAVALAHSIVLGLSAQAALAREADVDDGADEVRSLMVSAEERMLLRAPKHEDGAGGVQGAAVNQRAGDGRAGGGEQAGGKEGSMGEADSRGARPARFAVSARSPSSAERTLSREEALAEARSFGMIGLAAADGARHPAMDTPWKRIDEAMGADPLAAQGAMWGDWQGSHSGHEGLGLSGVGEGGGGKGEGIGLGTIGTIGHAAGAPGDGTGGAGSPLALTLAWGGQWVGGYATGYGSVGRRKKGGVTGRVKSWPRWGGGWGGMVDGRLPPEIVQRTLRQNFGRYRLCYENALRTNPQLSGRVVVRFVIGRDGSVSSVADGGSTLPDPAVVSCIVRAVYGLSFPPPEGGVVTVTYPLMLAPSD